MAKKDKKGLFEKVTDAFSSKDEKEEISQLKQELEEAKKEAEASKKAIKDLLEQNRDNSEAKAKAEVAEKRIKELENRLETVEHKKIVEERKAKSAAKRSELEKRRKLEALTTHTVKSGETLSHIALKYYKHATPPYWKLILEQNQDLLEGNERNLREGMEIEIPELPEDLKD
jgi:nucleoid-associated protein YgaU